MSLVDVNRNDNIWSKIINVCYKDERLYNIVKIKVYVLVGNGHGTNF